MGDKDKKRLLAQLAHLDANYSGGLPEYIRNAKKLLRDSQDGDTPSLICPQTHLAQPLKAFSFPHVEN